MVATRSCGVVHKGSNHFSMATIPDVCKTPTPGGPVPIPYPNVSLSSSLAKGTSTVKADGGNMIAIKGSEFSMSQGDEPGTAGGVKSSTFKKESAWILYSFDVKIEGKGACRLTDKKFQNHENTVDMMGAVGAPVPIGPVQDELEQIAKECNKAENEKAGVCPPKTPTGEQCKTLGTKKHKCCEKKLKERADKQPPPSPPIQSEVPFSSPGVPASATSESMARTAAAQAYHNAVNAAAPAGGAVALTAARAAVRKAGIWAKAYFNNGGAPFRADVLVGSPPTDPAFDFKFNCTSKVRVSRKQKRNYKKYTGLNVKPIHVDGRTC
jgi:hypothetical protein